MLNWNQARRTVRCLESVALAIEDLGARASVQVVVVDNGSQEEDRQLLAAWVADAALDITVVWNDANLGFARGMNRGLAALALPSLDFVLLLNNDAMLDRGTLSEFLACARAQPGNVILGATVVGANTRKTITCGGYRYYASIAYARAIGGGLAEADVCHYSPRDRLDYPDGCALWINASFLNRVGGLSENSFMYFEELRLVAQLRPGEHVAWCRHAIVYHEVQGSLVTAELRYQANYRAIRSALAFTKEQYPRWVGLVAGTRFAAGLFRRVRWMQLGFLISSAAAVRDFLRAG